MRTHVEPFQTDSTMKTLSGSILVVDDDPDIRDISSETLNSLGSRVITAANGRECLNKIDKETPELVLLDIEMPVKNGLEVLKELRQRGRETTAVMITAYGTIERAVQAMKEVCLISSRSHSISTILCS